MMTCVYNSRTWEADVYFLDSLAARSLRCGNRSEVSVRFWIGDVLWSLLEELIPWTDRWRDNNIVGAL